MLISTSGIASEQPNEEDRRGEKRLIRIDITEETTTTKRRRIEFSTNTSSSFPNQSFSSASASSSTSVPNQGNSSGEDEPLRQLLQENATDLISQYRIGFEKFLTPLQQLTTSGKATINFEEDWRILEDYTQKLSSIFSFSPSPSANQKTETFTIPHNQSVTPINASPLVAPKTETNLDLSFFDAFGASSDASLSVPPAKKEITENEAPVIHKVEQPGVIGFTQDLRLFLGSPLAENYIKKLHIVNTLEELKNTFVNIKIQAQKTRNKNLIKILEEIEKQFEQKPVLTIAMAVLAYEKLAIVSPELRSLNDKFFNKFMKVFQNDKVSLQSLPEKPNLVINPFILRNPWISELNFSQKLSVSDENYNREEFHQARKNLSKLFNVLTEKEIISKKDLIDYETYKILSEKGILNTKGVENISNYLLQETGEKDRHEIIATVDNLLSGIDNKGPTESLFTLGSLTNRHANMVIKVASGLMNPEGIPIVNETILKRVLSRLAITGRHCNTRGEEDYSWAIEYLFNQKNIDNDALSLPTKVSSVVGSFFNSIVEEMISQYGVEEEASHASSIVKEKLGNFITFIGRPEKYKDIHEEKFVLLRAAEEQEYLRDFVSLLTVEKLTQHISNDIQKNIKKHAFTGKGKGPQKVEQSASIISIPALTDYFGSESLNKYFDENYEVKDYNLLAQDILFSLGYLETKES